MKQPRKPTLAQKKLIVAAGLDPGKWSVTHENEHYLYLVERHFEGRDIRIIDKATREVMKEKSPEKGGNYEKRERV